MPQRKLEQILLHANVIDAADLATAAADAARTQTRLAWNLLESGAVDERRFAQALAEATRTQVLWSVPSEVPPSAYRLVPASIARHYKAVPLDVVRGKMKLAVVDPSDADGLDVIAAVTNLMMEPVVVPKSALERLLDSVYPPEDDAEATRVAQRDGLDAGDLSMAINAVAEPGLKTITAAIPAPEKTPDATASRIAELERELERLAALLDDARQKLASLQKSRG